VLIRTPKTVGITVSLDDHGKVVKASALPDTDAQQTVIDAALDAARASKFRPARRGDQPVSSEIVLRFEFKPGR
jgi:outer membrane biosynthesis protein TonB